MNYFKSLTDQQNYAEILISNPLFKPMDKAKQLLGIHFYHNIIFIEKGDNTLPSNLAPNRNILQKFSGLG